MDNTTENATGKKARKEFRRSISSKLELALSDLQNGIKQKKFNAAVKRASKLLANDLFLKQKKSKKSEKEEIVAEEIGA
jgi:hypothetical protein